MKHANYRQWLSLSFYGELSDEEDLALQEHLAECEECRAEARELRQMLQAVSSQLPDPPDRLLNEARAQLRGALRLELETAGTTQGLWRSRITVPLALAASLIIGLFLGWAMPIGSPGGNPSSGLLDQDIELTNIHFLDADPADGQLEVRFDAVRRVKLTAGPSDPRIQAVLLEALRSGDNPGTRIQAVAAVEEELRPRQNEALKHALIEALRTDDNVGVRRRALSVLQGMPRDAEIRQVLIEVLIRDSNAGLRVAAINALESDALKQVPIDSETIERLRRRLDSEDNDFIRLRSEAWLQEVRFQ